MGTLDIKFSDERVQVSQFNGITFVTLVDPNSSEFSIAALVQSGSNGDAIPGTAHYCEHLPFTATGLLDDPAKVSYMLERRGKFGAYTVYDRTVFLGEIQNGYENAAIQAISSLLSPPKYSEELISKEKETILNEWAHEEMNHDQHMFKELMRTAFGENCPSPILGDDKSIKKLGLKEIEEYKNRYYCADRLIVVMRGNFNRNLVLDYAKNKFILPRGEKKSEPSRLSIIPQTRFIRTRQRATSVFIINQGRDVKSGSKGTASFNVLKELLFGTSGVVMQEVRFGKRLAYGVSMGVGICESNFAFDAIMFDAFPAKVPAAVETIARTIVKFTKDPDKFTFNAVKNNLLKDIGDYLRIDTKSLEINHDVGAERIAQGAFYGSIETAQNILDAYKNLTIEDVMETAKLFLTVPAIQYVGCIKKDFPDHVAVAGIFNDALNSAPSRKESQINQKKIPAGQAIIG